MIERFAEAATDAKNEKQHGAVVSALTAMAKLAGLWVDRAENINGNYAISGSFCTQNGFYQNYLPRRARRR